MKVFIGFFICFFVGPVFSENLGVAPIDFEYESRLYNIYKNFHSSALPASEWSSVISSKNVNTYIVQKKDNLWDISQVLFGDSQYWPKLWSVNPYIVNPHRIDVGNQLSVIMGSESSGPQVVVSSTDNAVGGPLSLSTDQQQGAGSFSESICSKDLLAILSKKGSTRVYSDGFKCRVIQKQLKDREREDIAKIKKVGIPSLPPGLIPRLGRIPRSFPVIDIQLPQEISIEGLARTDSPRLNVIENYLVKRNDVQTVGGVKSYSGLPIRESEIVLELDIPVSKGVRLTLIHPLKKIKRRSLSVKGPFGYEVAVVGVVEILSAVPNESGHFFARIKDLYEPLSREVQVIEGTPDFFDLKGKVDWSRGSAQVVGMAGGNQSARSLAMHTFVYLNRGKSDNVNPGEALKIWSNPSFHQQVQRRSLGIVLVVHASDNFSTGFVTQLSGVAYIGDYVRPPAELTGFANDMDVYEAPEELEREDEDTFVEPEESDDEEEDLSDSDLGSQEISKDFEGEEEDFEGDFEEEDLSDSDLGNQDTSEDFEGEKKEDFEGDVEKFDDEEEEFDELPEEGPQGVDLGDGESDSQTKEAEQEIEEDFEEDFEDDFEEDDAF